MPVRAHPAATRLVYPCCPRVRNGGCVTTSSVPRLMAVPISCRVLPEQVEGPYRRRAHPERVDITEGREGVPLRLGCACSTTTP